jgi:hypothetical protein
MQGAILAGLTGYDSIPAFTCSSSNCSWPDTYYSLGVTSSCTNVTSTTLRTCKDLKFSDLKFDPFANETLYRGGYTCKLTTPAGILMTTNGYQFGGSKTYDGTQWQTASTVASKSPSSNNDGSYPVLFFRFATYRNPSANKYTTNDPQGEIFECSLSWTGYLYENVSVVSNNFKVGTRQPLALTPTSSDNGSAYTLTNPLPKEKYPGQDPVFTVNQDSAWSFQSYLETLFTGSYGLPAGINPQVGNATTGSTFGAEALYNANINDTSAAIASRMTERICSATNATNALGSTHELDVFVHVRWPWLILPLVLVFASLAFLITSIVLGLMCSTPLWKSSTLPLLFHSINPWNEEEHTIRSVRQMDRVAEATRVQLLRKQELEFHVM